MRRATSVAWGGREPCWTRLVNSQSSLSGLVPVLWIWKVWKWLSRITQLVSGEAGVWTLSSWAQRLCSAHSVRLPCTGLVCSRQVILIWTCPLTNDVEQLLMRLLAIHVSLIKWLLKYYAHFLTRLSYWVERVLYFGYKLFIRYVICQYFLPVCGGSFPYLFWSTKVF